MIISKNESLHRAIEIAHQALRDFRKKNGFGRAIAAPQVGFPIRMIALFLNDKKVTMFNPIISYKSEKMFTMWDDCLSFPNLMVCVRRHMSVSVTFTDEFGTAQAWEMCSQDISELLQHEIDHLDGVLAVDIAIKPDKVSVDCQAIVDRIEWLENKVKYISYVDYFIQ
jgi:peptide deformylase